MKRQGRREAGVYRAVMRSDGTRRYRCSMLKNMRRGGGDVGVGLWSSDSMQGIESEGGGGGGAERKLLDSYLGKWV